METSSQSSSVTGSSVLVAVSNPVVDDNSTSSVSGVEDCDTEAVPESEQSSSINSSSITPTDDESIMVFDSNEVSAIIHSNDQSEGNIDSSLGALTSNLQLPSQQWVIQWQTDSTAICKISPLSGSSALVITHCIIVNSDFSWLVYIHRNQVDQMRCPALSNVPEKLSSQSLQMLVSLLERFNVCPGHPDKHFVEMGISKNGKFLSKDGKKIVAKVDDYSKVFLNGKRYDVTVRSSNCELVVQGSKCASCIMYRDSLRRMHHRLLKQKSFSPSHRLSSSSRVNMRYLSSPEKKKRYTSLRSRFDSKCKEHKRLKETIEHFTKSNGIELQPDLNSDFEAIMKEMTQKVHEDCPVGSFRRIFWDQQMKAFSTNDNRQIRWHPAMIKWCLHMKFLSSGAYNALRSSGLVKLPSDRTLRDYTHWIRAGAGFQDQVDVELVKEANIGEEKNKYLVLLWDEMKIKEDLVFDKNTCQLIGFTDLGDINNHLDNFERQCSSNNTSSDVATHMLMFMVRGLCSHLEYPYAQFPTRGATADSLFPIVWESVQRLESSGFKVIAFTCDGASSNRIFQNASEREETYV